MSLSVKVEHPVYDQDWESVHHWDPKSWHGVIWISHYESGGEIKSLRWDDVPGGLVIASAAKQSLGARGVANRRARRSQ